MRIVASILLAGAVAAAALAAAPDQKPSPRVVSRTPIVSDVSYAPVPASHQDTGAATWVRPALQTALDAILETA